MIPEESNYVSQFNWRQVIDPSGVAVFR